MNPFGPARLITPSPSWADQYERRHRLLFVAIAFIAAIAGFVSTTPGRSTQLAILAIGVVFIALPHGAIDPWVALDRGGRRGLDLVRFVARYLVLAGGVIGLWSVAPVAMLVAFLGFSAWHFGEGELDRDRAGPLGKTVETMSRGATPILAPILLRPDETFALFDMLAGRPLSELAHAPLVGSLCTLWAVSRFVSIVGRARAGLADRDAGTFEMLLEEAAVWALFATLPVLLAFGLYFCLDHSIRHALRIARRLAPDSAAKGLRLYLLRAAPVTLATLLLGAGVGALVLERWDTTALVKVVFVGLAALTLPHVLLGVPPASDDEGVAGVAGSRSTMRSKRASYSGSRVPNQRSHQRK